MAIALALPAFAAPTASATLAGTGRLLAKGVSVEVPINYSCTIDPNDPYAYGYLWVSLIQRAAGKTLAQGGGSASIPPSSCDGTERSVVITVNTASVPFKKQDVVAQGNLYVSGEYTSASDEFSGVIQLK